MGYNEKMTEGFMDMAGRMAQEYDTLFGLFQTSIRILQDLNNNPSLGDYESDYNRNQEIVDFISQYKVKDPVQSIVLDNDNTENDELPF
jgi:hypothetical protein